MTLAPYLNFPGNTEVAFNFYKSVFGGEFTTFQRFRDIPGNDQVPAADQDKIMHVVLPIGSCELMGTDAPESMGFKLTKGNNLSISIITDSRADTDRIFAGLSAGGTIDMPLADMFWGAYFGMCTDQFGIKWMVNFDTPKA